MPAPKAARPSTSCPPSGAPGAGCSAVGSAGGRWAGRQRLVLGQEAVAGKANEITAIPPMVERLQLAGALVTIDALGCQTKIAQAILAQGADYLLAVKSNWPSLHAEIAHYSQDAPATAVDRLATTDGDHGRIEVRHHAVSRDVAPRRSADRRSSADGSSAGRRTMAHR